LNDANIALLIYNPGAIARAEAYAEGNGVRPDPNEADEIDYIIGKRRSGPPCTVRGRYWPSFTLFGDCQ
jgi:replicative DNA helicase